MVIRRVMASVRNAHYGALFLEIFVVVLGILLALAAGRLRQHVDYFYTTDQMNEEGMGVRYDFATLAADRDVKNGVFEAIGIHGDWLGTQIDIYRTTRQIGERLGLK